MLNYEEYLHKRECCKTYITTSLSSLEVKICQFFLRMFITFQLGFLSDIISYVPKERRILKNFIIIELNKVVNQVEAKSKAKKQPFDLTMQSFMYHTTIFLK